MSKFNWFLCNLIIIFIVKCDGQICDKNITDIATGLKVKDISTFCRRKPCIFRRCNRVDEILLKINKTFYCRSLEEIKSLTNVSLNLSQVNQVYRKNANGDLEISPKTFRKDFIHIKYPDETNLKCAYDRHISNNISLMLNILEDGSLNKRLVIQNDESLVATGSFLVEFFMRKTKSGSWKVNLVLWLFESSEDQQIDETKEYYTSIGLLVSCFFLTLLLVVYGLLRQWKSLANLILLAHVFTIDVGFLLKAIQNLNLLITRPTEEFCRYTSWVMHFSLLSSFFWMNVMTFDIWWTFRGTLKNVDINRRGVIHKFCMYSLYAFGVPFLLTAVAVIIDSVDTTNQWRIIKPGFDSCIHDSTLWYIYLPFTILIIINVTLFLSTSVNIWRIKKSLNKTLQSSRNTKKNENRFMLYIKMFMLTGINWIVDLILYLTQPPIWLEYVLDTYNMLIGVVIFAMYICRKEILLLIFTRRSQCKEARTARTVGVSLSTVQVLQRYKETRI